MDRITSKHLEQLCRVLNNRVNGNNDPLWRRVASENVATIGAFYIDGAYGGVALYRIVTDGGGVTDIFRSGHMPKRDLYARMTALLDGIDLASELVSA